ELGHSAFVTGLLLMSVIIGGMFVSPITEPLSKRVDGRWLVIPGFLLVAGGTFWLAHVSTESGWAFFLAPLAIAGAGFVAQEGPTMGIRDRNVSPEQFDDAWCISYTIFLLGVGTLHNYYKSKSILLQEIFRSDLPGLSHQLEGIDRPAVCLSHTRSIHQSS